MENALSGLMGAPARVRIEVIRGPAPMNAPAPTEETAAPDDEENESPEPGEMIMNRLVRETR